MKEFLHWFKVTVEIGLIAQPPSDTNNVALKLLTRIIIPTSTQTGRIDKLQTVQVFFMLSCGLRINFGIGGLGTFGEDNYGRI